MDGLTDLTIHVLTIIMLQLHKRILQGFGTVGKKSKIILFGSVAKGNYRLDSDIDIAIITNDERTRRRSDMIANGILGKYGKVISIKYFTIEEFLKKRKQKDSFVMDILKGKVIYSGG